MVVRLSAVSAVNLGGAVGAEPGSAEREPDRAGCAADDRQHRGPRSSSGSGRKRGTPRQGVGRSRGGFTTKIHLRVNAAGLPMRTEITAGQTSDYLGFDLVMADNLPEPSVLFADRGYDSDNIRKTMEVRDVVPVIPMRKTRKLRVRRPQALSPEQPRRAVLQQAQECPSSRHPLPQDRRKLPGLHRHHIHPPLAPPFVNMT